LANYVLVHGGHGGGNSGSVWDKVVALLQNRGQKAFAPTLSASDTCSLEDHISEVCALIENGQLRDVMLVGHSYASFVITGVADKLPGRIKHLVYVDSSIPENGKSLFDMFELSGVSYKSYAGLTPDKPFVEPLNFDAARIKKIPKTYVHCTLSEFLAVCGPFVSYVAEHAKQDNWDYFELKSDHLCMVSHPEELAAILLQEAG